MSTSWPQPRSAAEYLRIFGCFSLQEIGTLAHRSDISDSIGRTLALTTDLGVSNPVEPEKPEERALIMYVSLVCFRPSLLLTISGLGVGIAAAAFARKGYEVDIVGRSPRQCESVQQLTVRNRPCGIQHSSDTFQSLQLPNLYRQSPLGIDIHPSSGGPISPKDDRRGRRASRGNQGFHKMEPGGARLFLGWQCPRRNVYASVLAGSERVGRAGWHRCYGSLISLGLCGRVALMRQNFVGLRGSRASRAVLVTLLSVFEQCRAFSDGSETDAKQTDIRNMVSPFLQNVFRC